MVRPGGPGAPARPAGRAQRAVRRRGHARTARGARRPDPGARARRRARRLRDLGDRAEHASGTGEVKRVYVAPEVRGRGLARTLVHALEARAADRGWTRLVLEAGLQQPDALGLYLSLGYRPVARYGEWADVPDSRCLAKALGGPAATATAADGAPGPALLRVDPREPGALDRALASGYRPVLPFGAWQEDAWGLYLARAAVTDARHVDTP